MEEKFIEINVIKLKKLCNIYIEKYEIVILENVQNI